VLAVLALHSDYRLTEKQLGLSGLDLTLDDTRVQGSAAIDDLGSMALSYDLSVNGINVDRYLPPVEKSKARPAAHAQGPQKPPTPLPIDTLRKLDAHGTLRVGNATVAGLAFSGVSLPLTAKDGRVHLGPTQAHLFGGGYNGDIVLDARPAKAQLSLNEHVRGMDVGALMKATFKTARVVGRGDADAAVTAIGNTDADMFRTLAGKVDVNVKQGAIDGIDLWYEIRRARALLKREPMPARTGPERTVFNTLTGNGVLDKGVLRNDDLRIETDYLKARGKGTLDLETKRIDYQLVAELYKLPPEGAGSELADLKAAEIPLSITGTLEDMKVRPDIEALAKARVRQEVNEKVQQKTDELKKKLGDKLKDLLGH
jgi:AsmA protein